MLLSLSDVLSLLLTALRVSSHVESEGHPAILGNPKTSVHADGIVAEPMSAVRNESSATSASLCVKTWTGELAEGITLLTTPPSQGISPSSHQRFLFLAVFLRFTARVAPVLFVGSLRYRTFFGPGVLWACLLAHGFFVAKAHHIRHCFLE